jgi:chemotaxis protein CheX
MSSLDAEIEEIVTMIWSTLMDQGLEPGRAGPVEDSTVTGIVNIDGAWQGAVLVQCPYLLASHVTATMLRSGTKPSFEELCDALGELTNMVAGNVKALLPQPSSISLPTVALGSQYEISVVGARTVAAVPFTCGSQPLLVSVVQRPAETRPGAIDE